MSGNRVISSKNEGITNDRQSQRNPGMVFNGKTNVAHPSLLIEVKHWPKQRCGSRLF